MQAPPLEGRQTPSAARQSCGTCAWAQLGLTEFDEILDQPWNVDVRRWLGCERFATPELIRITAGTTIQRIFIERLNYPSRSLSGLLGIRGSRNRGPADRRNVGRRSSIPDKNVGFWESRDSAGVRFVPAKTTRRIAVCCLGGRDLCSWAPPDSCLGEFHLSAQRLHPSANGSRPNRGLEALFPLVLRPTWPAVAVFYLWDQGTRRSWAAPTRILRSQSEGSNARLQSCSDG